MATIATQRRQVRASGRTQVFAMEMRVIDAGDLADRGVFLMQIVSPADPSLDRFVRVCIVADLVTFLTDRVEAVRRGDGFYRVESLTRELVDVRVAQRDAEVVSELVNALVEAYAVYADEYTTDLLPGEVETITYPLAEPVGKAALVAAYDAAVETRDATQAALTAKTAECSDLTDRVTELEEDLQVIESAYDDVTLALASLVSGVAAYDGLVTASNDIVTEFDGGLAAYALEAQSGNTPGSYDYFADPDTALEGELDEGTTVAQMRVFRAALLSARAARTELSSQQTALQARQASLSAQVIAAQAALDTARTQSVTCTTARIGLQYTLNAHNAAVDAARDELLELCPDYDFEA